MRPGTTPVPVNVPASRETVWRRGGIQAAFPLGAWPDGRSVGAIRDLQTGCRRSPGGNPPRPAPPRARPAARPVLAPGQEEFMKTLAICAATAASLALGAHPAAAQSKTITGETKTVTVTVEGIERAEPRTDGEAARRHLRHALRHADRDQALRHPQGWRQDHGAVLTKTGAADEGAGDRLRQHRCRRGLESARRQTRHDGGTPANDHRDDCRHRSGRPVNHLHRAEWLEYSSRVEDTAALAKVKVGDKLDITWTEALLLSIDDAKSMILRARRPGSRPLRRGGARGGAPASRFRRRPVTSRSVAPPDRPDDADVPLRGGGIGGGCRRYRIRSARRRDPSRTRVSPPRRTARAAAAVSETRVVLE